MGERVGGAFGVRVVVVVTTMRVGRRPEFILLLTAKMLNATPPLVMMMMTAPEITLRGINTAAVHFLYIINLRFFFVQGQYRKC
jgi:hypothetical protein